VGAHDLAGVFVSGVDVAVVGEGEGDAKGMQSFGVVEPVWS